MTDLIFGHFAKGSSSNLFENHLFFDRRYAIDHIDILGFL